MSQSTPSKLIDPDLYHRGYLTERGHQTARLIETVRGKYITSAGDAVCMKGLHRLIVNAGMRADLSLPLSRRNRCEGRLLVITGDSGAGKSRRLKRTLRKHPALIDLNPESPDHPVVFVSVPSPCTLKQLGRQTLAMTGYPLERDLLEHLTWEKVRRRLDRGDKLIVVYDEMQHITQTSNLDEQKKIADTIKDLLNNEFWRVSIIVCGLPEILDFIRSDIQLHRRSRFIALRSLTMPGDNADVAAMVSILARVAGLSVASDIETDLAPRLIHAAGCQWGTAIDLTHEAIESALEPDYLDLEPDDDEIDLAGATGPSAAEGLTRHRFAQAFEELIGCSPEENPFVSRDWTSIRMTAPATLQDKLRARAEQKGRRRAAR